MSFAHLHTHTEYSLLDGSNKIKEYVQQVKKLGMEAAAITDHGVMYGVIDFYRAARAEGIKPIIGCEVYVAPNSRFDKEITGGEERYHHLVLLAENNTGYHNLMKIVSKGFTEGYYYRPRVDMEILQEYHEGIIALSACLAGEVPRYIEKSLYEEAKSCALKYQTCFGTDHYFLELQDHGIPEQKTVNQALLRMSQELNIPLVATNDIHYTYADDVASHDILLCIQTGKKLQDEDRMRYEGGQFYVKSPEEMRALFPYAQEAIENTGKIAERCNVEIEFGVTKLPRYDVPEGHDAWSYLNKLCFDGLEKRYPDYGEDLKKRLEYELDTIHSMGFVDYFLITWDFIHYAKSHGIAVGPGRGSAAGSIVSYCLEITNIDPIKYNLLFERFLNPERVSMPDIDIDFCFERRQEVIDYVVEKYGKDKVVQIVTFGTLAAKGVIRDVGRVMDLPYSYVDSIAKMIPNELNITIDRALESNNDFKKLYDEDEQVHNLIDMCRRLEGLPRHTSMHAAGVVICQKAADEFVPLSRGSDGSITTQFTMTTLEELGLLKMDFLGLRTLTVIQNAVQLAEKSSGKTIDIDHIDYNDKAVLDSIGTGHTDGVFQLESAGMKSFMKELKPQNLEDVIAGISLYRPGPMQFIPQYIKGKHAAEASESSAALSEVIRYDCSQLEPILAPTYGCIVYQEQVMQIVRELGGYTLGRSDLVRRAMSKKKQSVMEKERANFIGGNAEEGVPGCAALGISSEVANKIYDNMMDFAQYAFNKSHAACYAVVSYETAYLKYYYPLEYMAALMTSVIDAPHKLYEYFYTCRTMNIPILPPDINQGDVGFTVAETDEADGKRGIRYSLSAIKGIGRPIINEIVAERHGRGSFTTIKDFITRLADKDINKRVIENLIKAGAFDSLPGTRKQLMSIYVPIMDNIVRNKKNNMAGQISLFDIAGEEDKDDFEIKMPDVGEYSKEMILGFEKEVIGIYISGHPLEEDEAMWKKHISAYASDFTIDEETGETKVKDQERVTIGGIIEEKTIKYTKSGKNMAFIVVEDLTGKAEVIVWPNDYEKNAKWLIENSKVFVYGRVSAEEEKDAKLICEKITPFESIPRKLWIKFATKEDFLLREDELLFAMDGSDGNDTVVIYIEATKEIKSLPRSKSVCANSVLLDRLSAMYGQENVRVV